VRRGRVQNQGDLLGRQCAGRRTRSALAGENEPEVRRQRLDPLIEDDPLAKIWQRPVVGAGAIVLTSSAGRVE